jgi:OmpA-OmpF porin, OOP family
MRAFINSLAIIIFIAIGASSTSIAQTQPPSSDDILRALKPSPGTSTTRGLRGPRGIEVVPSEQQKPPSIDLYINFKFNSAELEPEALVTLRSLSAALNDPQLKEAKIMIVGHTDAVGDDNYNMQLSERRADAVRKMLIAAFSIDAVRLQAMGRGKRELKDPSRPDDGINRRVEIRNVSAN